MNWTEDRVATLVRMAAEGKSFGEVGEALGCTRNCVAGKANRLGVTFSSPAGGTSPRHAEACRKSWAQMTPEARALRLEATTGKATRVRMAQRALARA
jgi:hypothetical protein